MTLNMSCHFLVACSFSGEKLADNLMGIPLSVIGCFSLTVFNICCLYLIFISLVNMFLAYVSLNFSYMRPCASWTWFTIFFLRLGRFLMISSSDIFSGSFSFSSSSGITIIWMLVCLMLSQSSLRLSSFLLIHFFYSGPQQLFCSLPLPVSSVCFGVSVSLVHL